MIMLQKNNNQILNEKEKEKKKQGHKNHIVWERNRIKEERTRTVQKMHIDP